MPTATMTSTDQESILLKDFLDERRIPYIYVHVETNGDEGKKVRKGTIPTGWQKWDYNTCMKYNDYKADPKCEIMSVNLQNSGLIVVDIDGGDNVDELVKHYGGRDMTKSINRKLPHLWFNKPSDYPFGQQNHKNGQQLDYLVNFVYERKDSIMQHHNGYLDDFDWETLITDEQKQKLYNEINKNKKSKEKSKNTLGVKSDNNQLTQYLDLITDEYWGKYNHWFKLLCAIKTEFTNYEEVAIHYSTKCVGYENAQEDVILKLEQIEEGQITGATIHYYAKLSNPKAYHSLLIPYITPCDEMLATLFLNAFGINLTRDINGENFVYYKNEWRKIDDKWLLHALISDELKPLINKALEITEIKIELCDSVSENDKLETYKKQLTTALKKVLSASGTESIYKKVMSGLSRRDKSNKLFDIGKEQLYNIHFKNGVYELKNRKFRKRTKDDYITKTLDWYYSPKRNEEQIKMVDTIFKKIQPNQQMHTFMMEWLASCLDGDISREKFKMNIGSGSNGKTMEFSIHTTCFPTYCCKLTNKTFNVDYQKYHKDFAKFLSNPIRFACVEELDKDSKLDIDRIKDFVSGKQVTFDVMYGNTASVDLQATLNTCSNYDPHAGSDGGIIRRGLLLNYNSKFMDIDDDDYENHIYKKERGVDRRFDNDEMKLAYFHYLMDYYNPNMIIPKEIEDAFQNTLDEYDQFKQIMNKYFNIEKNADYMRVHREEVIRIFESEGIKGWRNILREMKKNGIQYERQKRVTGYNSKGAFVGISLKDMEVEECEDI